MRSRGRFQLRPTRFVGVTSASGWRLKRYEITLSGGPIPKEIDRAVDEMLDAKLPPPPPDGEAVGFLIAHQGKDAIWLLADLWNGDILSQHTFSSPLDRPTELEPVPPGGPTACVWELAVHTHERDAFIRHVLDPPAGPDLDAYLSDVLISPPEANKELVERFNTAWREGDVDALMRHMADDPCYRASTGPGPGTVFRGRAEVEAGFKAVIQAEAYAGPAPPAGGVVAFPQGAISFWSYVTESPDGRTLPVEGVDVWSFRDGRIAIKDAYRKSFPDPSA